MEIHVMKLNLTRKEHCIANAIRRVTDEPANHDDDARMAAIKATVVAVGDALNGRGRFDRAAFNIATGAFGW
jgi:hypothetical protein